MDASLKMGPVFRTDSHKCHVTVLSCVNVMIATGIASSTIAVEIQFAKQIQITTSSDSVYQAGKEGFHGRRHHESIVPDRP